MLELGSSGEGLALSGVWSFIGEQMWQSGGWAQRRLLLLAMLPALTSSRYGTDMAPD
jgi:hypothetical protein